MTKKEYIERETAMHIVKSTCGDYATAFSMIRKLPAADVVEVVRCKDCKHYVHYDLCYCRNKKGLTDIVKPDDFCSYGEKGEL